MLQASAISALLSQLVHLDGESSFPRPHTAILSLLETSELYAVATQLTEPASTKSAVASMLASTAAASGSSKAYVPPRRSPELTLDERATCLSAIAVTAWRQATSAGTVLPTQKGSAAVHPGTRIAVAKHAVTGLPATKGAKTTSPQVLVPLLLECELGRLLVMPIFPGLTPSTPSRADPSFAGESHEDPVASFHEAPKPFMLLTLNADLCGPPSDLPKSPSSNSAPASVPGNSAATLSASQATRSRLRSGGATPTSVSSDHTATPSRSPVSEHFPTSSGVFVDPQTPVAEVESGLPTIKTAEEEEASKEWDEKVWADMYGQAQAFARLLGPNLAKGGVGEHHNDDDSHNVDVRRSGHVSDNEMDE